MYGTNGQSSTEISDRESQLSIRKILEATGTSVDTANKAAIKIQVYIFLWLKNEKKKKKN